MHAAGDGRGGYELSAVGLDLTKQETFAEPTPTPLPPLRRLACLLCFFVFLSIHNSLILAESRLVYCSPPRFYVTHLLTREYDHPNIAITASIINDNHARDARHPKTARQEYVLAARKRKNKKNKTGEREGEGKIERKTKQNKTKQQRERASKRLMRNRTQGTPILERISCYVILTSCKQVDPLQCSMDSKKRARETNKRQYQRRIEETG